MCKHVLFTNQNHPQVVLFPHLKKMLSTAENQPKCNWYAMRATYHREMSVKEQLEQSGFETYLPMTYEIKTVRGRKCRVMKPAVSNLLFVKSDKSALQRFKTRLPHLQYITRTCEGRNVPIVVPERQMENFISVTTLDRDNVLFFTPNELNIAQGTRVKIHGGVFDGLEGVFMRVSGKRNRRVVIEIANVVAAAVEVDSASYIEILKHEPVPSHSD